MFKFFVARKSALYAADAAAGQLILAIGGQMAILAIKRDLRWLGHADAELERELTLVLRAIEKRLGYRSPTESSSILTLTNG